MLNILKNYKFSILTVLFIFVMSIRSSVPNVFNLEERNRIVYSNDSYNFMTISLLQIRDFLGHACFYFVLSGFLIYESLKQNKKISSLDMIILAVFCPILYGGVMELVQQYFFPPRAAEWLDWFADMLGVLLAYGLAKLFINKVNVFKTI